ncbi:hypothetical protein CPC16_004504 [Podila verticillata]|nr:hypothetical protein CPC16_004504 [Podila verticillata]
MTDNLLCLFCVVDGESTSFSVEIDRTKTVDHLKKAIKAEKSPRFDDIAADELTLWRVSIPDDQLDSAITIAALDDKTALSNPRTRLFKLFPESPDDNTYILVQRPLQALKRGREHEFEDPQKLQKIGDWVEYAAKDGPVELPPVLVNMLNSEQFTSAPRNKFKQQLDDIQVGQRVTLPSIGQRPKHYGEGYQELSFFITEQMVEMWRLLSSNSDRPIRRVLSGPMGVGKSYLALFLAAKAYAEGWLLLYVSDANELAKATSGAIASQICMRFLALNKDLMTVHDFEKLLLGHQSDATDVLINAATSILDDRLQQPETKTLLVIDEHGALFEQDPPVPKKHVILNPLMQLAAWRETSRGARVVLTGTAHAKFERQYVRNDMWDWMEYVTPLSDVVFNELLNMDAVLSRPAIEDQVKEITNRVPRELVNMAAFVRRNVVTAGQQPATINPGAVTYRDTVLSLMNEFQEQRHKAFYLEAYTYFKSLDGIQRHSHRNALAAIFLPRKEGDFDMENKGFDYQFMDLGLVYRIRVGARTEYRPLCPAANDALLDIYKSMPLPGDTMEAITGGNPTSDQFEDGLFTFLMRHSEVILDTTNLVGEKRVPVIIRSNSVKFLQNPPASVSENVLIRCYKGHPRFDYVYGRTFIQVSVSDFAKHNVEGANFEKAFERPTARHTRSFDNRNQIEKYLDGAFGGVHKADIDPISRRFVVSRKGAIFENGQQVEDTRAVEDFKIVYISGKPGKPNHTGKIKDFPDVLHVSFDELQKKLFGELISHREFSTSF